MWFGNRASAREDPQPTSLAVADPWGERSSSFASNSSPDGSFVRSATAHRDGRVSQRSSSVRTVGKLLRGSRRKAKSTTRYRIAEHHEAVTAAKVSQNLGDTVTSVAISDDMLLFAACSTNKKAMVMDSRDGSVVRCAARARPHAPSTRSEQRRARTELEIDELKTWGHRATDERVARSLAWQ